MNTGDTPPRGENASGALQVSDHGAVALEEHAVTLRALTAAQHATLELQKKLEELQGISGEQLQKTTPSQKPHLATFYHPATRATTLLSTFCNAHPTIAGSNHPDILLPTLTIPTLIETLGISILGVALTIPTFIETLSVPTFIETLPIPTSIETLQLSTHAHGLSIPTIIKTLAISTFIKTVSFPRGVMDVPTLHLPTDARDHRGPCFSPATSVSSTARHWAPRVDERTGNFSYHPLVLVAQPTRAG
ncbi:hypothetical protein M427DRAFT_28159 [Gonapodya prolifera JEL478]|uniref:Uncharacterized protein n=1 Tax=Gonapodya prolifera (strain JEL478) TaxID=1344416 RepID=A0A139AUL5_GONPJ|nr:hypothetical protein M427DRAFT_28159 [Gonapodya prolifera JEL478]|eukprot:KXS20436.1 hypothetical protein M427DRAFT_28159 [Gonapodya prolifera JEL478]